MMHIPVLKAAKLCLVYIPGDIIKATIASILVFRIKKSPAIRRQLTKAS